MLAGLDTLQLGRLRLSIGYGTHKNGRPLSPIEVGKYLQRARDEGVSLSECAKEVQLRGTGHIGRFLRILALPSDLHHLITWGRKDGGIGFSMAVELGLLKNASDQRAVANAILQDDLNSREVRQVAQLRVRSGRPIEECLKEVIGMRPTIEKHYVFIGYISESATQDSLVTLTQAQRDVILGSGIQHLDIKASFGRLGTKLFTLVGDARFEQEMRRIGKENMEKQLRLYIAEAIEDD